MGGISRWPSPTPHLHQDAVLGNALEAVLHDVPSHEAQDLCNGACMLATSDHRKKNVGMPCELRLDSGFMCAQFESKVPFHDFIYICIYVSIDA